ncbi:MAG: hypothetical protein LBS79_04175, partial [Tannerella sp.]|nr:hypothetical protein [Tannerella sp.]
MEKYLKTSDMYAGLSVGRNEYPKKYERFRNRMMFLLFSGLWLLSACRLDSVKDGNVITFTWETDESEILLCAEKGKEVGISWGDFKKDRFEGNGAVHTFNHTYSTPGNHRVTIRGDVTLLECNKSSLTSLNVKRNSVLTVLRCNQNQLTTLDISRNTALSILDCSGNLLTELNVNGSPDSLRGKQPAWLDLLRYGNKPP